MLRASTLPCTVVITATIPVKRDTLRQKVFCCCKQVLDRDVEHLSGGELQRFAIAVVAAQLADVYMIDEPSSYLDVRQRLKAAQVRSSSCCSMLYVEP